jgi:predicted hydrocarbon binding protein
MNYEREIGILGVLFSIIGTIGTYFQIFGPIIIWPIFILTGMIIISVLAFKKLCGFEQTIKTFSNRWRIEEGQLIIGNTINVALRTDTVQGILDCFRVEIGESYEKAIRIIGKKTGEDFARDLVKELTMLRIDKINKKGNDPELIKEKLSLWAQYDSGTGMGIFDISHVEASIDGFGGYIILKNSFLANNRTSKIPSCAFIEGYLEGIIQRLIGITISAKEVECHSIPGTSHCKFILHK